MPEVRFRAINLEDSNHEPPNCCDVVSGSVHQSVKDSKETNFASPSIIQTLVFMYTSVHLRTNSSLGRRQLSMNRRGLVAIGNHLMDKAAECH